MLFDSENLANHVVDFDVPTFEYFLSLQEDDLSDDPLFSLVLSMCKDYPDLHVRIKFDEDLRLLELETGDLTSKWNLNPDRVFSKGSFYDVVWRFS